MLTDRDTQLNTAGIRRRDFIVASGAAVATAALGTIGLPTRLWAQSAKTQITFASARFFATDTMQQVVDKYNKSQNSVQVTYIELPPPSSSSATRSATRSEERYPGRFHPRHHLDRGICGSRLGITAGFVLWR
jgi:hypothetical protein